MIARAETRKRARGRRLKATDPAQHAHQRAQITINAVLYQIIRQNAETAEGDDFDATKHATLTVPMEEFKSVPKDFGLQVKQDDDGNIIIIASGVEEVSNLTLPSRKIVDEQGKIIGE